MTALLLFLVLIVLVLVVLFTRLLGISERLRSLELDVRMLKAASQDSSLPARAGEQQAAPPVDLAAQTVVAAPPLPTPPPAQKPPPSGTLPVPPKKPKQRRTTAEWEWLIGGKLLNRIAALALIIGVSFFLKYAIDREWISEWIRVAIGATAGALLLIGAARAHRKKFQIFAQGLVGAGIAILYLSVYACFNYYALVSQPLAFVMMSAVTVITFTQAFRYNSFAVCLLGWAGGFLTPFLLHTGDPNPVGLFGYVALLDAGLLAIVLVRRRWDSLIPLGLAATYAIYYLWYSSAFTAHDSLPALIFLSLFCLLFHLQDAVRALRPPEGRQTLDGIVAGANLALAYGGMYAVMEDHYDAWTGLLTLLLATLYAATSVIFWRRGQRTGRALTQNSIAAVALLVLATEIQFKEFATVSLYAVEAAFLVWAGTRLRFRALWGSVPVVLSLAFLTLIVVPGAIRVHDPASFTPLLNARVLAFLLLISAIAFTLVRFRPLEGPSMNLLRGACHVGWVILAVLLVAVEITDTFRWSATAAGEELRKHLNYLTRFTVALAWTAVATLLILSGRRTSSTPILWSGVIVTLLAFLMVLAWSFVGFVPIEWFQPVLNARALALAVIVSLVFWQARTIVRAEGQAHRMKGTLQAVWIATGFLLITGETNDAFARATGAAGAVEFEGLLFARLMCLAAFWAVYATLLIWYGAQPRQVVPVTAGIVVSVVAVGVTGARGIAIDPVSAFVPLLNVRAGVILLVAAAIATQIGLLKRATTLPVWVQELLPALRMLAALLLLVLVTGEIRDFYEHRMALLPAGEPADTLENLKQLFLSAAWLVYSIVLMMYGIWRRMRSLRMLSMFLFGFAILKIFVYDLSFLDTLYRIFSFVGLGLILLAVSYMYQRYRDVIFAGAESVDHKPHTG